MNTLRNLFILSTLAFSAFQLLGPELANGAAPFDSLSLQGYLKTAGGTPVHGTFNGRVSLLQNSIPCWNSGATLIPIVVTEGAFSKTLSGGVAGGACAGALKSDHFLTAPPFTWTLDLDMDNNGTTETSFTNIPITPVPLAMVAERITGSISASDISGGTFGAIDGSALFNLNGANIASGFISTARLGSGTADATTYLRGDGSWQTIATGGETNTASNTGAGSQVFKQKTGVNLEFRSMVAGSTKITLAQNANDISLDVAEANLSLANIGGTLSGGQVSGGTFGAVNGSNLTNLNGANIASGFISTARLGSGTADATTYLRGDGSWQTIATGETNTASNTGAGSQVFKQKTGVNLEFRSMVAGSTKITLAQNANDISLDVAEANLSLANIGGTLSGSQVSGGTFGAVNGSNLTNLPAGNLTGALPAISGASLTNLNATNLSSGTVASARLPLASDSTEGIITTSAQTIAGDKTLNGAVTMNGLLTNMAPVSWDKADVATTATINCLSSSTPVVRLTGTTITAINGINPGVDGQILIVYTDGNIGTGLTIGHNNGGACANGRIFTNTNANVASTTATSTAAFTFIYNGASARWHLIVSLQ